jgi:hypothetical protein
MRKTFIILSVFALLNACDNKKSSESTITIDTTQDYFKQPVFTSVKFIPLETDSTSLLGDKIRLKFYEDEIFILDLAGKNCVMRFTSDGHFLNAIGQRGRGEGEYVNLQDYSIFEDTVAILDSYSGQSRILKYSKEGSYLSSIRLDFAVFSFEKTANGYILSTGYNRKNHKYRIHITDNKGEIQSSFIKDNTELNLPMFEPNFFRWDSGICIHEVFEDEVYKYSSNTITETYSFDLGDYSVPDEFFEKEFIESFPDLNKHGFANLKAYFESPRLSVFIIDTQILKGAETYSTAYQIFYDKFNHSLYRRNIVYNEVNGDPFQDLASLTNSDELVYILYPDQVVDNIGYLESLGNPTGSYLSEVNEMDNPIIALIKLEP